MTLEQAVEAIAEHQLWVWPPSGKPNGLTWFVRSLGGTKDPDYMSGDGSTLQEAVQRAVESGTNWTRKTAMMKVLE